MYLWWVKVTVATNKSQKSYFTKVFVQYYSISTKAFTSPEDKNNTQAERKTASFYMVHKLTLFK